MRFERARASDLLVTVEASTSEEKLPLSVLDEIDRAMQKLGFRKEMRSVIVSGKVYSTSYEGPDQDQRQIEEAVSEAGVKYAITTKVDFEESVKFP